MKHWHLYQDWTLEVHEDGPHGSCGQSPVYAPPDCKIIGKFPDFFDDELTMLIDAHNAIVNGKDALPWETAFARQNMGKH